MKRMLILSTILFSLFAGAVFAQPSGGPIETSSHQKPFSGTIHIALGLKQMDTWWEPVEDHGEFGILADFQPRGFPLSFAFEGFVSADEEDVIYRGSIFTLTGETTELCVGIKKYIDTGSHFYPFIGGGVAFIDAEATVTKGDLALTVSDSAVGFWLGGGCIYVFKRFSLGGYVRYSNAEVNLLGESVDAGGVHLLAIAGFRF
jgi:hypothetical protein